MALTVGSRLGPYEILSALGAGGMGEVYRAKDTRLERTVAIKVLPQHLSASAEVRQRFEREARTISQLSHPHICALYDVGNQDGVEYLVMEYLEGETLADRLVRGPLPLEQTLRCGMEIAGALDKAHRQGIVLRDDPKPISQAQPAAPAMLDRVVRVCMAKDPEDRWQSARDVENELRWVSEGSSAVVPLAAVPRRKLRERLAWALCAALLLAAAALAWVHFREKPAEVRTMRFAVFPPEQSEFALGPAAPNEVLSPDGRSLALAITTPERKRSLWIRSLDSLVARKIPGTDDGSLPFWSPDSRFLGFFANSKLKTIDIHGGSAQTLCDTLGGNGGAWSRDGIILFASSREGALQRVAAAGGACSSATTLDRKRRETAHAFPQFLPDGRHFLYLTLGGPPETRGVYVTSLGSQDSRLLLKTSVRANYVPVKTRFNESQAQFSLDARWVAYVSDETGNNEVYVQTFPPSGAKWQISTSGGRFPRWRRDGKELFYVAHDEKLMSVALQTSPSDSSFQAGPPRALFQPRFFNIPVFFYTVSGDGRRFLVNTPLEGVNSAPVTVVLNWAAGLKK